MFKVNDNYLKLPGSYLFSTIGKKVSAYSAAHPDKKIIRLGIGDVTQPLAPAIIDALHGAVDEMGKAETFHGYAPDLGYEFLRNAIAENDYKARGCDIAPDEIFVSDGAKCDCGNIQEIFSLDNKIDQYRSLEKYNNGYAYNMMFVGPGWLNKMGRWEQPYELLKKSYEDGMKYYGDLKKEGKLTDMTMAEFADYYRQKKTYTEPECALWRDILYGSDKQLFWYCDPFMRACVNMDQGGAIVDLRPYAAKLEWPVGIGTKHVTDASYPFLIQEKYRAGYFTHYAGEGTVRSAKLKHNGEEVDLCLCRTKAHFSQEGNTRILTLDPVDIEFYDLTVKLQTIVSFEEGSSAIKIERKILEMSDPNAEVELNEYIVACYGTTEYSEDMLGITLSTKKGDEVETLDYEYKCREMEKADADEVRAVIPQIETAVSMSTNAEGAVGYVKEGYAFSPMFTLGYNSKIKDKEVVATWLKLEKAN